MSNVLVVENNALIRTMYATGLRGYGLNVLEARTIAEAKFFLQNETGEIPYVVLIDLLLDNESGEELIHYIRKVMKRPDIRIIVITGTDIDDNQIINMGADLLLTKPVELIQLCNQVTAYSQ